MGPTQKYTPNFQVVLHFYEHGIAQQGQLMLYIISVCEQGKLHVDGWLPDLDLMGSMWEHAPTLALFPSTLCTILGRRKNSINLHVWLDLRA